MQLFTDAVSNSDYKVSNAWMVADNELEGMWQEATVASFKILSGNLLRKMTLDLSQNSVLPKMWTGHFKNASQKCHHLS